MADDAIPEDDVEFEEEEDELVEGDIDPEDLDEDVLDEEDEEDAFGLSDDDELAEIDEPEGEDTDEVKARRPATEEEDDDEDLVDPDDVEADLDRILKDRLVAADEEGDDDEEEVEVDDRGDPVDRILPKRPGEFVCQSCFLVKHPSQLADADRQLCADCV
jgi:hypothetical protein